MRRFFESMIDAYLKSSHKVPVSFTDLPKDLVQEIGVFLDDQSLSRLAVVNKQFNGHIMNATVGFIEKKSDAAASDFDSTHRVAVSLSQFTRLQNHKRAYHPTRALTVCRGISNLTPDTFRGAYTLIGSVSLGMYASQYVVSALNNSVHHRIGGNLLGDVFCALFVTGLSPFGLIAGYIVGKYVGKFNNDEHIGTMLGGFIGLLEAAGTSVCYGVGNFLSDYHVLPNVSFTFLDDATSKVAIGCLMLVTGYGLYRNKKWFNDDDAATKQFNLQFKTRVRSTEDDMKKEKEIDGQLKAIQRRR